MECPDALEKIAKQPKQPYVDFGLFSKPVGEIPKDIPKKKKSKKKRSKKKKPKEITELPLEGYDLETSDEELEELEREYGLGKVGDLIAKGDFTTALEAIKKGADRDICNLQGMTLVHLLIDRACYLRPHESSTQHDIEQYEKFKKLLHALLTINNFDQPDLKNRTPVDYVLRWGRPDVEVVMIITEIRHYCPERLLQLSSDRSLEAGCGRFLSERERRTYPYYYLRLYEINGAGDRDRIEVLHFLRYGFQMLVRGKKILDKYWLENPQYVDTRDRDFLFQQLGKELCISLRRIKIDQKGELINFKKLYSRLYYIETKHSLDLEEYELKRNSPRKGRLIAKSLLRELIVQAPRITHSQQRVRNKILERIAKFDFASIAYAAMNPPKPERLVKLLSRYGPEKLKTNVMRGLQLSKREYDQVLTTALKNESSSKLPKDEKPPKKHSRSAPNIHKNLLKKKLSLIPPHKRKLFKQINMLQYLSSANADEADIDKYLAELSSKLHKDEKLRFSLLKKLLVNTPKDVNSNMLNKVLSCIGDSCSDSKICAAIAYCAVKACDISMGGRIASLFADVFPSFDKSKGIEAQVLTTGDWKKVTNFCKEKLAMTKKELQSIVSADTKNPIFRLVRSSMTFKIRPSLPSKQPEEPKNTLQAVPH